MYHNSSSDPYLQNVKYCLHKCQLTSFLRAPRVPPASNTKNWSRRSDRDKRNCSRISRRRNVMNWIKKLGICLSWSENENWKGDHLLLKQVSLVEEREGQIEYEVEHYKNVRHWNLNGPQRSTNCWRPSSGYFLSGTDCKASSQSCSCARSQTNPPWY